MKLHSLIAIAILIALSITQTGAEIAQIIGDLNGDGVVDMEDVTLVEYMVIGKLPADLSADSNGNGRVDASAPSVSIGSASVNLNETVKVQVSLSNITNVAGLSLDLVYDPSIVTVESVSDNNSVVTGSIVTVFIDNTNGATAIALTNTNPITSTAKIPIIDLTLKAVSSGTSDLNLENVEITNLTFIPYPVTDVHNGTLTVLAPPKPTISINTDKSIYSPRDTMKVSVNISNPSASSVIYELYLGVPQFKYWKSFERKILSSGEYSFTYSLKLGNFSSSFSGIWFGHLLNSTSSEVLAQDSALWIYDPIGVKVSKTEDIAKVVELQS